MTISGTRKSFCLTLMSLLGFPGGSVLKKPSANAGNFGSIPWLGRSPGGGQPTPVFLPGKSPRQRSLAGYSLWGCKKSDTTVHIHAYNVPFGTMVMRRSSPSQEMSATSWHPQPGHTLASSSATVTLFLGRFQQIEVFSSYLSDSW